MRRYSKPKIDQEAGDGGTYWDFLILVNSLNWQVLCVSLCHKFRWRHGSKLTINSLPYKGKDQGHTVIYYKV